MWKFMIKLVYMVLWAGFRLVNCTDYFIKSKYCYGEIESFIGDRRSCEFQISGFSYFTVLDSNFSSCNTTCGIIISLENKWHSANIHNFSVSQVYATFAGDIDRNQFKIKHYSCGAEFIYNQKAEMYLLCGFRKGKKFLGDACQTNEDCNGTPNGGICRHPENLYKRGKCHCNDDFTEFGNRCLQENRRLHEHCEEDVQCNGTEHASKCSLNVCICEEDFIDFQNECLNYSVGLGDECKLNAQCLNNGLLTHCSPKKLQNVCSCMDPYIKFDQQCILGNLSIGAPCKHHIQCYNSDNDTHCSTEGICSCIQGRPWNGSCLKVNKIDYKSFVLGSGGFLLGVFSTVIVFASFRKGGFARRENQRSVIRLTSDTRNDVNQYSYVEHRDIRNQIELSSYNPEHQNIQTENDTYNHLHEERQNISENDYGFFHSK
ncbi:uncharacterized protein LOC134268783 isoform X2 [Saccostrea cucullata]|uniref:uncharacterized protein LOC134268783 isoform X2 n=1 Tax=Saccostrea cuccullata TaxID=36930 RepID=UPI002ED4CB29